MAKSSDVSPGDEATAVQHNALRDDALRLLLNNKENPATLSSGVLTLTEGQGFYVVAAESGTADQLDTTSGGSIDEGDIMVLQADSGDTITIADSASSDGFVLPHDNDVVLKNEMLAAFVHNGTAWEYLFSSISPILTVAVPIGGGGGVILDGTYTDVRWEEDFTLKKTSIMADVSGTIDVTLQKDTWANYPPGTADTIGTISLGSAIKGEDTTLSGWAVDFSAGDVVRFYVDGDATTITQVTVEVMGARHV